ESIGGGLIRIKEIDGFAVNITGDNETLIITHKDRIGILSEILNVLSLYKLNIVTINSVRHNKLDDIKTIITFDNFINPRMRSILTSIQDVVRTRIIHKIQEKWQ
ncbi:MAG TPA: L-serine ammonia-lyase, iron-sulfur-dependent, subunit beta, partial [bacterium]|nr:L-serine ammonia-lyase, iron-sulfur-dependent, subunit beta [bacterium]